jgi:hypothetical protein
VSRRTSTKSTSPKWKRMNSKSRYRDENTNEQHSKFPDKIRIVKGNLTELKSTAIPSPRLTQYRSLIRQLRMFVQLKIPFPRAAPVYKNNSRSQYYQIASISTVQPAKWPNQLNNQRRANQIGPDSLSREKPRVFYLSADSSLRLRLMTCRV